MYQGKVKYGFVNRTEDMEEKTNENVEYSDSAPHLRTFDIQKWCTGRQKITITQFVQYYTVYM